MDLNIKIIEGVKQFPSLHDHCSDLDKRNHAWLQLAKKLDMNVQVLQIRWHSLLQLYQLDDNFRYTNKMQFIYRSTESKIKEDNWPEFIITEDYLKDYNNEVQEQFIYLETEEEKNSKSIKPTPEHDNNFHEKYGEADSNDNKEDATGSEEIDLSSNKTQIQVNVKDISPAKTKENDDSQGTNVKNEDKIRPIDVNKSNKCLEEAKEGSCEKTPALIEERCEDVIFGELVSATLKRMDETKKKSIKKEIMNLLFS